VNKPRLLLLTSSFPCHFGDFSGGFVADFAQALTPDFTVTVLHPPSSNVTPTNWVNLKVSDFTYLWPRRWQRLTANQDLQTVLASNYWARLQVAPFMASFCRRACQLAAQHDLICAHWLLPAGFIGAVVSRLYRKPLIVIEHSGAWHLLAKLLNSTATRPLAALLGRFVVQQSSQIVTVSQDLAQKLLQQYPEVAPKTTVLPMGVNVANYQNPLVADPRISYPATYYSNDLKFDSLPFTDLTARDKVRLLFLGRLTDIKGVDLLLQAIATLPQRQQLAVVIAGDGEARGLLQTKAQVAGLSVEFVGAVNLPQKQYWLNWAEIVVIPSRKLPDGRVEGFPVVALEAMAAGKAIIAAAVGGLPELIQSGQTGLLFPSEDLAALSAAITTLILSPRQRTALGQAAQISVRQYDWPVLAEKYKNILHPLTLSRKIALRE
jgi:glycosyltransferase involved in cell wall biosynthesis